MEIGTRVQSPAFKVAGVIIDELQSLTMNGTALIGPKYMVLWDNGEKSGWLSANDLKAEEK